MGFFDTLHIPLHWIGLIAVAILIFVFEIVRIVMQTQDSIASASMGSSSTPGSHSGMLPEDRLRVKFMMAATLGGAFLVLAIFKMGSLVEHSVASVCLGMLLMIITIYASFVVPDKVFDMLQERRLEKMNRQLVDAMNVLALALRSGRTFEGALPVVATQIPQPLAEEFERVVQEVNVGGVALDQALTRLAERVPVKDMQIFVSTSLIVSGVGGSQADILDKNAQLIRERFRIKQKIHSLTAEGRFSAFAISLAPVFILLINFLIDSETVTLFVTNPIGMLILFAIFTSDYIGYVILSKLVKIEF